MTGIPVLRLMCLEEDLLGELLGEVVVPGPGAQEGVEMIQPGEDDALKPIHRGSIAGRVAAGGSAAGARRGGRPVRVSFPVTTVITFREPSGGLRDSLPVLTPGRRKRDRAWAGLADAAPPSALDGRQSTLTSVRFLR